MMASSSHDKWSTRKIDQKLAFVCERPVGDFCLFDMLAHDSHCYDFNFDPEVSRTAWSVSRDACTAIGLQIITIDKHGIDDWITNQLYNSGLFSQPSTLNGMWLGYQGTYFHSINFS